MRSVDDFIEPERYNFTLIAAAFPVTLCDAMELKTGDASNAITLLAVSLLSGLVALMSLIEHPAMRFGRAKFGRRSEGPEARA